MRRLRATDFDPPPRTFTQQLVRNMGEPFVPRNIMGGAMRRIPQGRASDYDPQPKSLTQYLVSVANGDKYG